MRNAETRVRARFFGRVQGVGFRYTARSIAGRFAVSGYVRNLPDGSVELVAEGPEEEVLGFIEALRRSHLAPNITHVETVRETPQGVFDGFRIAY